jgi:hypothetical protein
MLFKQLNPPSIYSTRGNEDRTVLFERVVNFWRGLPGTGQRSILESAFRGPRSLVGECPADLANRDPLPRRRQILPGALTSRRSAASCTFCVGRYENRFAANKHSKTVPDVIAITVMLISLPIAVENIDAARLGGDVCLRDTAFAVRFFDAMFAALEVSVRPLCSLTRDASLSD